MAVDGDTAAVGAAHEGGVTAGAVYIYVRDSGGNWAEHQWVMGQLENARILQDSNSMVEHNFELFQKYQQEIETYE